MSVPARKFNIFRRNTGTTALPILLLLFTAILVLDHVTGNTLNTIWKRMETCHDPVVLLHGSPG